MSAKGILFRMKLAGQGVVNFDSKDQRFIWNSLSKIKCGNYENIQFAKHRWYQNADEEKGAIRKIAISSDCLRHNIFIDDFLFQSPAILASRSTLCKQIATIGSLLRGYLFPQEGLKKKSAFAITDAEQTNNSISTLETFSKSGHRESKVDEDDSSDATFFKREVVGEMEYAAKGYVDLKELQFISLSELYDRMAVVSDDMPVYRPLLEEALGSVSDPNYYVVKNSSVPLPEHGILLSAEQQKTLVKELFNRMLQVMISKSAGAYAQVTSVEIKIVEDPFKDKMSSEDGWIEIHSGSDVDFDPELFYTPFDGDAEKELADMEARLKESKSIRKTKKNQKKGKKTDEGATD